MKRMKRLKKMIKLPKETSRKKNPNKMRIRNNLNNKSSHN